MAVQLSTKRLQISKANATIVIVISVAAFVTSFSLVASKALFTKRSYQGRVITEKQKAVNQLKKNVDAVEELTIAYKDFVEKPQNIISGNTNGTGPNDGNNARLTLDALPSKYDFPALTASLEMILSDQSYLINTITGTDEEATQQAKAATSTPKPIEMPFEINVTASYAASQDLIAVFERSIRPFKVITLSMSGNDAAIEFTLKGLTYYQPEKTLDITTKVVQ